jgi:hypothetical protein
MPLKHRHHIPEGSRRQERMKISSLNQSECVQRQLFFSVAGRHLRFIPSVKGLDRLWTYSVATGGFYPGNKVVAE